MKHSTSKYRFKPACTLGLFLASICLLPPWAAGATSFQPNDEVKLTRDVTLLFSDKPFRKGTSGETFKVLAYKSDLKKVFLATKDASGKPIAVSVSEDTLALIPEDKAVVQTSVLSAVTGHQLDAAKSILNQALRTNPDDVDLHTMSYALDEVIKSAQQLNQCLEAQKPVEADIRRRRRNADVTDHTNPLDPSDHSGQQRAQQIRAEANEIEVKASQSLRTARTNFDAAISAFQTATAGSRSPTPPGYSTKVSPREGGPHRSPQPVLPTLEKISEHFWDPPAATPQKREQAVNEQADDSLYRAERSKEFPELDVADSELRKVYNRLLSETEINHSALYGNPRRPLILAQCAQEELESRKRYDAMKEPSDPDFSPNKYAPGGSFDYGSELIKLDRRAGTPTDIIIVRKLQPEKFPDITTAGGELYQFEFGGATAGMPGGLLVATWTTYTSAGSAHVDLLREKTVEVEDGNGFTKKIPVYRQGKREDEDKLFDAIKASEQLNKQLYPVAEEPDLRSTEKVVPGLPRR